MSSSLRISTSMNGETLVQHLLAQKAENEARNREIEAQLASLQSSSTSSTFPHRIQKQHSQRRRDVPRSLSKGSPTMARHSSQDRIEVPQPLSRSLSQRSAPAPPTTGMYRTSSGGYPSQGSSKIPFAPPGRMPPPLNAEPNRENPSVMSWTQDQQPLSEYTYSQLPLEDIGENPHEFLSRRTGTLAMPMPIPYSNSNNQRVSASSPYLQTPATPTTALTDATTLPSEMSRQNSLYNDHFLEEGVQMLKVDSSVSYSPHIVLDQYSYEKFPSSQPKRRSSTEEQSQLLVGAGASHGSMFSQSFQLPSSSPMEKSHSSSSTSSSKSSRSHQRLQDQIKLAAARSIMPKGGLDENSMSRENSSQSMARQESKDKIAISSKTTYVRPKHERVYCEKCENHPEGFRGEHELRRHVDREHKTIVKKWVCVMPNDGKSHPEPTIPLSKCKSCNQQRKKYGAYYNAGAHLRRAHFNPKPKGRGKTKPTAKSEAEGRGGKGGGDWPAMDELKCWIREVEERVAPSDLALEEERQEMADASDEEMLDGSFDNTIYSQPSLSISSSPYSPNESFQQTSPISIPVPNNYNYLSTNTIDHDLISMQMPVELSQQNSCMDSSMYLSPVHTQFPISASTFASTDHFQNGAVYFPANLPQNIDLHDQSYWS